MSSDIKKPPIAPKPKHASVQKPIPPPVAPKPDVVQAKVSPASKKLKPTIAPKPKVLQSPSVSEEQRQSNVKSNGINNDEYQDVESEKVSCKHETSANNKISTYIISPCSCSFDCDHKLGNGDSFQKTQKVIEQLENLENRKVCGQPVPCVRTRWNSSSQQDKLAKTNQVILRASILEDKVKDVLTHNLFANGYTCKQENSEKSIRTKVVVSSTESSESDLPFSNIDGPASNTKKHNLSVKEPAAAPSLDVVLNNPEHKTIDHVKECNGMPLDKRPLSTEHCGRSKFPPRAPPPLKSLPVPKPRKLRTQCLVRQDCVDGTAENNGDQVTIGDSPQTNLQQGQNEVDQANDEYIISKTLDSKHQNIQECESNVGSSSTDPTPTGLENETESKSEEDSNFKRCSSLSMSLPKQLKLIYEQLPVKNAAVEKNLASNTPAAGSPRVAPKKPQRFSLPAAGLLKKAASEEKLHSSNDSSSYGTLGQGETSQNQSQISEKPSWKLEHPILPFLGNPELLKTSLSNDSTHPLTKPRAKSLSSVDMNRIENHTNESPKKNTLKKFLNFKLSVCVIKNDFQKFLSRGSLSLSGDNSTSDIFSCAGHSTSPTLERKIKPSKAHSADSFSPLSKKKQKNKSDFSTVNNPSSKSLDDSLVSLQRPQVASSDEIPELDIPQYENICHYEEIPEYENLPFTVVSDLNECDATIYEVEDPVESVHPSKGFHVNHSGVSQEDPEDDVGMVLSDEEEIINSSDEDEFSSDSSKTDLDNSECKSEKRPRQKTKVYYIAKEIMSSEKVFVDVLKLLHIDFRYAVAQASKNLGKPVIEDRILNQILYYLPQLYELNRDVLRELQERMSQWNEHQKIADIFVKKGPYLKMYSTYIREFDPNVALLDEQCKKNSAFAGVVKDFEMNPRCANLALRHYLLKPVQRIPQYRLLLTDYLKNLSEESSDYSDTQAALSVVTEVANHANDILKQGDNFQKLMQIQYSLNGHHEIVQPGRVFLKEGTLMKLSRKVMQPRMFFLFNDALLYTTPVQSGMFKLNNMLSLAGMKVRKPTQEAYQNELNIESVERSFILSASSASERDDWLEAISTAIEEYAKKKTTFNPTKSQEETDPEEEGDNTLGSKAPIWIPDGRATMCMICTSEFTLTYRRHHCRACGKIVCQACSTNKYSLEYLKYHLARVCDLCFQQLQKQDSPSIAKSCSPANHKSPSSALSSVLHSIPSGRKQKKIPAALKLCASTEDSSMSGYLQRSKGSKKPWKQMWFVIKNKVLYTYAASEDIAALESQPLLGFTVSVVQEESTELKVIHLLHKNTLFYTFRADDAHTTERWIEAFQEGTVL
ncbi:PREDICTED: FYVE, RhoGEF and PH domain-containing protein 6 [Nanorana parkeri]|uniref:FYVE, RhoGEF and PH domain-containing protein 6 n=1 Tax=Nanorana parkeri TaxID=125878 RepID=UPI00085459FC|nr:PREDICTED: FYVE, RhoGEF and PH domain-containing protein 6 [Nanorana parkeri]